MMNKFIKKTWNSFLTFWFGPSDTIRLDTFRVLMGISILMYMLYYWPHAKEWLTTEGFHASAGHLPYHPFFLPPLAPGALPWFGFLLFGSITAFIAGFRLHWSAWLTLVCLFYVTFVDQLSSYTLNKMIIVSLAVLAVAAKGSHWSIEQGKPKQQSVWPIRILQITLITHYFFSGWSKAVLGTWLSNPYVLWSQTQGYYRSDCAAWMLNTFPASLWTLMQWSALIFELAAPLLFTVRFFRPFALALGFLFHILIALAFDSLFYFSAVVLSFYVLFIPEENLHRVKDFLKKLTQKVQFR